LAEKYPLGAAPYLYGQIFYMTIATENGLHNEVGLGLQTFGDIEKLESWLDTPNFALGGHTPRELLCDPYGRELVVTELQHINHGIF
jgi:hypothetical protein